MTKIDRKESANHKGDQVFLIDMMIVKTSAEEN